MTMYCQSVLVLNRRGNMKELRKDNNRKDLVYLHHTTEGPGVKCLFFVSEEYGPPNSLMNQYHPTKASNTETVLFFDNNGLF